MAEIWPNLLPHKTFRADASLRQRLDSGHFLFPALAKRIQNANRVFLFNCELSKMNPMINAFFSLDFCPKRADSVLL
ncbi:hypothetical protein ACX928_19845 [Enterobacter roggenkampii]